MGSNDARHYRPVTDLPGSYVRDEDGSPWLVAATLDELVARVREAQASGAAVRCQRKEDGCWCALRLDERGRVASATSRAGLPLAAAEQWVGAPLARELPGWVVLAEAVCRTQRAQDEREDRGERAPRSHRGRTYSRPPRLAVYGLVDTDGRRHDPRTVRARWPAGVAVIDEAPEGSDWGAYLGDLVRAGAEGVVLHGRDGRLYRAKARIEVERWVRRLRRHRDREGHYVWSAEVACSPSGRPTQRCEIDGPAREIVGRQVTVRGEGVSDAGVVRHGRIVRVRDDLPGAETHAARATPGPRGGRPRVDRAVLLADLAAGRTWTEIAATRGCTRRTVARAAREARETA